MEQAGPGKKLVRREVVRVITPGTATSLNVLERKENNYLAALARAPSGIPVGLAYADITTGEFRVTEFSGADADEKVRDELDRIKPREILLPRQAGLFAAAAASDGDGGVVSSAQSPVARGEFRDAVETRIEEWAFRTDYAERMLREQFGVASLDGVGLAGHAQAMAAPAAMVQYLRAPPANVPESGETRETG